jgi:hypothetical protein
MKNIIIVCDEKRKKFGNYLAQLISMEDDTEENVVGIKDGSVEAQVWSEKEYKGNSKTISSDQHILFIGNSKELKSKREFMNIEFSKYGMKYGSLGKQSFIAVDEVVKRKEYEDFYSYAKKYAENLEKVIKTKRPLNKAEQVGAAVGGTVAGLFTPFIILGPLSAVSIVMYTKKNNEIKEQMYCCAVMKFYLDFISEFLGL